MTLYVFTDRKALISCISPGGIGAEIGVFAGEFAQQIRECTSPSALHLIDAWEFAPYDPHALPNYVPESQHAAFVRYLRSAEPAWTTEDVNDGLGLLHDRVRDHFADDPSVTLHRGRSLDVLKTFPENSFDFVYIDADHDYQPVLTDLWQADRTLKPGGLILGHDFDMDRTHRHSNHNVIEAVMNFAKKSSYELVAISADLGSTYVLAKQPIQGNAANFFANLLNLPVQMVQMPQEIIWNYRRRPIRRADGSVKLIPSFRA